MRLSGKLFLGLAVCGAAPLALVGGLTLWSSGRAADALLDSSERTGERTSRAGEEALFAESRRLHRQLVERRAGELADFFEEGRKLVALEAKLAERALIQGPEPAAPPTLSDQDVNALLADPARKKNEYARVPYSTYNLAPGLGPEAARPEIQKLARLGDYHLFSLQEYPWVKSLYLGTADGLLVGYPTTPDDAATYDPRTRDWYLKAVQRGRVTWTSIYFDTDRKPVITCAAPFFVGGKLAGVAAADIGLEKLIDRLFDLKDLPARDALLVNVFGGVRIAAEEKGGGKFSWKAWKPEEAPPVRGFLGGKLAPAFEAALKQPSGTLVVGEDLLTFAQVPIQTREQGKNWYYLARTPVSAVLGPARETGSRLAGLQRDLRGMISAQQRRLSWQLLAALALALLGALVGAWLGADRFARPLRALADSVRRIGRGEFDVRVPVRTTDEVGEVSRAVNEMAAGLKEGVFVKSTFKRFVSATMVDQLIKDPSSLRLGGEERELTVFFSDMSGFTSLSEQLEPSRLVELINEYLSAMTESIFAQEGTLDKYEGDAIMAFWGAPMPQADHARRACWAALDNRARLAQLQKRWRGRNLPEVDIRIGLNTGRMIVGNVGSLARMDYTVLGDAVNAGQRLEQANKLYGTRILMSEATREAAGGAVEAREIDLLAPKGKQQALRVYELLGLAGQIPASRLRAYRDYEAGLAAFRSRLWDQAEAAFRASMAALDGDKASGVLLQRVLVFREHPPAPGWDGVFRLDNLG